ncbi:MAG: ribonuclease HI family protein [Candidatus Vogelbacteria bacterium]|nr:ribonuclease HI family protein [Candidatus Vogelbacteria bacterium]
MENFIIYTDGGARGNPGPAGAGAVVTDKTGAVLREAHRALGVMTNNEAEYQAVILGLETVKKALGKARAAAARIELRLDSELVVKQLAGKFQIKETNLQPLFMKIWNKRVTDFPYLAFIQIPRSQNRAADRLANQAMDDNSLPSPPSLF